MTPLCLSLLGHVKSRIKKFPFSSVDYISHLSLQIAVSAFQAVQVDTQKMEEVATSLWRNLSIGTQQETTVLTVVDTLQGLLMKLNRTGLSPSLGKFQITRPSRSQSCLLPQEGQSLWFNNLQARAK